MSTHISAIPFDERILIEIPAGAGRTVTRRKIEALLTGNAKPTTRRRRVERPAADGLLRTASEAAAKLRCSIKTLNGHVASGALGYVTMGHGTKRPRRFFTDADLNAFVASQTRKDSPACPSSVPRARRSGTSISGTKIIAFTAQPRPGTGAKPKK